MSPHNRVVVTGLGAVCALGQDMGSIWAAVESGRGGIAEVELDPGSHGPPPHRVPLAQLPQAALAAIDQVCAGTVGAQLDPFARSALYVARMAVADAALPGAGLSSRTAVIFGHGTGGTSSLEASYARFFGMKTPRMHPLTIPRGMVSSAASVVAMDLGVKGPVFAVSSACSSSGNAIVQAAMMIRAGAIDAAIVGGSESSVTPGFVRCWEAMEAMSKSTCRPFCGERDGMVLGEGAAALILENRAHAEARGAPIYAELVGEGCTSDASHLTQPSHEGPIQAITLACEAAALPRDAAILVSAHGTGTKLNDKNETVVLQDVFGDHQGELRVIATKSAHGHLMGASTAIQAALGLLALKRKLAPPVLNFVRPDPECELPLVVGSAQCFAAEYLLSNSFAFGGLNVALLFRECR